MPRNDSHYGGTWYKPVGSLVGKPRGIPTDPFIHGKGSVNLLLQLGRKEHVHAPTRDDERLPWGDSRSSPRSMSALEKNPQVPAPTPHKILGPASTGEESREVTEQLAWGLAFPEAPERVPEVPVVSREHLPQLEKIQEVLPSRRDEAHLC